MNAQNGNRRVALLFINIGSRYGWVFNATPRPVYRRERPVTHCIGDWVGLRAGMDGCENHARNGIRSRNRRSRSNSLYRMSHLGPFTNKHFKFFQCQCV